MNISHYLLGVLALGALITLHSVIRGATNMVGGVVWFVALALLAGLFSLTSKTVRQLATVSPDVSGRAVMQLVAFCLVLVILALNLSRAVHR